MMFCQRSVNDEMPMVCTTFESGTINQTRRTMDGEKDSELLLYYPVTVPPQHQMLRRFIFLGVILITIVVVLVFSLHFGRKDDVIVQSSERIETNLNCSGNPKNCFPTLHLKSANKPKNGAGESPKVLSNSPNQIYQGYSSVSGAAFNPAVEGSHVTMGGRSSVDYYVCTDVTSVFNSLDIGVSAFLSFGTVFGIDAKVKFVRELRLTAYSVSIVVHSRHTLSTTTATEQRLKDGILPPKTDEQLRDFVRLHGDSFIGTLTLGSEYYAAFIFHATSTSEQTGFVAELAANSIFGQGVLNRGFGVKLASVLSSASILYSFNQSVAGIANPKLPNETGLIDYALSFVGIPVDSPVVVSYDSIGYENVLEHNDFLPVVRNRVYFIGDRQTEKGLAKDLVTINSLSNNLEEIANIYKFYNYSGDDKIQPARARVQTDLDAIADQVRSYSNDPLVNLTRPPLDSLKLGTPQLQYSVGNSDPQGSYLYGSPFDDVDINSHLQRQTRISAVAIGTNWWWKTWSARYAYCVSELTTTYQDRSGIPRVKTHGGGGYAGNTLQLLPDQYVWNVAGKAGEEVDWLQVTITDGRFIQGGDTFYGDFFNWSLPVGSVLMGFNGRSDGAWVYQIGMSYATLQPAKWSFPV